MYLGRGFGQYNYGPFEWGPEARMGDGTWEGRKGRQKQEKERVTGCNNNIKKKGGGGPVEG